MSMDRLDLRGGVAGFRTKSMELRHGAKMNRLIVCGPVLAGETIGHAFWRMSYDPSAELWTTIGPCLLAAIPAAYRFANTLFASMTAGNGECLEFTEGG